MQPEIKVGPNTLRYDESTKTYVKVPGNEATRKNNGNLPRRKPTVVQKHEEDSDLREEADADNRPGKKKSNGRCNHRFRISATFYFSNYRLRDLDGALSTIQDCLRDAIERVGNPEGLPHDDNLFWISEIGSIKHVFVDTDAEAGVDVTLERLTPSGGEVCQLNLKPKDCGSLPESPQPSLF